MSTLIVAEIALALALVAGAGWLVQSFERLGATDPGFTATGRLVVDVRPTRSFAQRADMEVWSNDMLDRVRASAGGARVGSASTFPLRIDHDGIFNVEIDGDPPDPDSSRGGRIRVVTPGFFEAMGIQVLAGRTFTADDRKGTQPVAIVNRTFAHHYFQGREPLAGSFAYGFPTVDRKSMSRIVGVVQDVRYKSLAEEAEPTFYLVQAQAPFPFARQAVVVAARAGDPQALVSPIRAELNRFDPQLMVSFTTAPQIVAETLGRQKLGMTLMLIFGATALVLAAIGIYGVIAYAAAQRSGELATRIALGAAGHQIFWLMMSTGQRLAIAGVILGLAAAYAGGRLVASSVFAMRAADPVVLIGAGALVAAVACIATMIPAIRASRLDPVRALRAE
jgi:putative ABC transport system permease protein